jgi:hypothetical protein
MSKNTPALVTMSVDEPVAPIVIAPVEAIVDSPEGDDYGSLTWTWTGTASLADSAASQPSYVKSFYAAGGIHETKVSRDGVITEKHKPKGDLTPSRFAALQDAFARDAEGNVLPTIEAFRKRTARILASGSFTFGPTVGTRSPKTPRDSVDTLADLAFARAQAAAAVLSDNDESAD